MEIKYKVTFIPKKESDLTSLLSDANKKFEDSFEIVGRLISTKEALSNLDEKNMNELKSFSEEKKMNLISTWISDDISQGGMDFYDHEKNDNYSVNSNLGSKNIDPISFMVLCGAGEYLSEVLF